MSDASAAKTVRIHDTHIVVWLDDVPKGKLPSDICPENWTAFRAICKLLKRRGFSVVRDPRIERDYKLIGKWHRYGRKGDLEFKAEIFPRGFKFEFFQNLVVENKNGGEYDFDKLAKMPYLIRKQWELTAKKILAKLEAMGFVLERNVKSPVHDPLAYFNDRWDTQYERSRGIHRFARDETGWPTRSELGCMANGRDRDGVEIHHGDIRYFRNPKGYLMRARVYGGINGIWMAIYGPGASDWTSKGHYDLFTCRPTEVPRKLVDKDRRKRRLASELKKAVAACDFERCAKLRDVLGIKLEKERVA